MRILHRIIIALIVGGCSACNSSPSSFERQVQCAVEAQYGYYPEMRLTDLYKHFFQDRFGPGHLLADTLRAKEYLRQELLSFNGDTVTRFLEPTGWEGNYVRVHLAVIQQGYVSFDSFFAAFLKSLETQEQPSLESWTQEWNAIESVIARTLPHIPYLKEDSQKIALRLAQGEWVGHHSQRFDSLYHPHYRILRRAVVEQELLPKLPVQ